MNQSNRSFSKTEQWSRQPTSRPGRNIPQKKSMGLFLALALCASFARSDLRLVPLTDYPDALCNDGSVAGY